MPEATADDIPTYTDVPVGIDAQGSRREFDSLGSVDVPGDRYWGAQTQRSLIHFSIGNDHMPIEVYHAYGLVKKACALVNERAGRLSAWRAKVIVQAADEAIAGKLDGEFPLFVWQTGSGTQSNMNVNEVLSNRAIQLLDGELGSQQPVGPNDHVNMGQSSNDTFPTAMHIAAVTELDDRLIPKVQALQSEIDTKAKQWTDVVKIGRTHLEDAVPLTVGQEWSGYAAQLEACIDELRHVRGGLLELAVGGTAVGTGLNAPAGFSADVAAELAKLTGAPYVTAPNKFAALGSLDPMVRAHAALRGLAVALMKIANDMRWLASGPRCGLGELLLPANEPGSSIMPGKVNPTQCEALVMIAIQVMGNDTAVSVAGSQGNFELNAMRPVIINNFLHSARILGDGCEKFLEFSVRGTSLNTERIKKYVSESLMLVTSLSPVIGYQNAAHIAEDALAKGTTLREAAIASGHVTAKQFDSVVNPLDMVGDGAGGRLMPNGDQPDSPDGAIDLVLDAAALLHVNGQSTGMTLTAVDRLNRGLSTTSTLIPAWASLLLVGPHAATRVAAVSPTGISMRRVAAAMAVIDRAEDGPLDRDEVRRGLAAAQQESVSNTLIFSAACATGAGALAVIFGAQHPLTVLVAAVSAALGGLARRALGRFGAGILTQAFAAALVAGLIGVAAAQLRVDDALGLVVLCPAMVLVPGPHILNGALDLLALRVTLGIARLGYAALILAAIAAGLILGLAAGGRSLAVVQTSATVPLYVDVIAAGVAAGSYPVFFSMPYRMIGWPVAVGMLGHAAHWWALSVWQVDIASAALVSCLIAGTLLVPISHYLRMPFAAIGFASVVALVPGVYVFRMLSGLVQFARLPTSDLLTSLTSDGATAALVITGMATGLAVPMHAYSILSAAADKRRSQRR